MRAAKNILIVVIIALVAYNSVYFAKLDEVKTSKATKDFDAKRYADIFWATKLFAGKAVEINDLMAELKTDPTKAFDNYSHALGIGNLRYFLVKGKGKITKIDSDYVEADNYRIATEFIFGNAVRDASGLIDINEFTNTVDFNNVSSEINMIIREKVLPEFKSTVAIGDNVEFTGAIELNKEHLQLKSIEVIPVQLKIIK
jgi:predicted lipoprotein